MSDELQAPCVARAVAARIQIFCWQEKVSTWSRSWQSLNLKTQFAFGRLAIQVSAPWSKINHILTNVHGSNKMHKRRDSSLTKTSDRVSWSRVSVVLKYLTDRRKSKNVRGISTSLPRGWPK